MSRLGQARQATRRQLKARVAFDGPSGSGKTWTSLEWATVLADHHPEVIGELIAACAATATEVES